MPTERRKNPRLGLAIPTRVQGFLPDGTTWDEMTATLDVSSGGACFPLSHEAELGQVLLLILALPKRLRQYDLMDVSYRVYSLVRSVRRRADQPRVGVMFFGKHPPRGFHERPAARYLLPSDSVVNAPVPMGLRTGEDPDQTAAPTAGTPPPPREPPPPDTVVGGNGVARTRPDDSLSRYTPPPMTAPSTIPKRRGGFLSVSDFQPTAEVPQDRRAEPRAQVFVNFMIQLVDEWGAVLQEELTVADNLSRAGARVMTTLSFQVGEIVLLQEAGGGFATRAAVRGVSRVQSSIDRLHLQFIDRQAPDRLLKQ